MNVEDWQAESCLPHPNPPPKGEGMDVAFHPSPLPSGEGWGGGFRGLVSVEQCLQNLLGFG